MPDEISYTGSCAPQMDPPTAAANERERDEDSQVDPPDKAPAFPGFGLPLNFIPRNFITGKYFLFPSALDPSDVFRGDIKYDIILFFLICLILGGC